jgi:MoaA/NifB/PqqE/SkfB family radical SAM enzyme
MPDVRHHLWFTDWLTQRAIPRHRPEFVYLDVFDGCDGTCRWCLGAGVPGQPIADDLYRHIVAEMKRWGVRELSLSTNGESMLHPDLPSLVAEAAHAGLEVYFATGGHHIDSALAWELVHAGVSGVAVSLETIPLTESQSIPKSWESSLASMDALLRARGSSELPRLTVLLPLPSDTPSRIMDELSATAISHLSHPPDGLLALHRHDWHGAFPGIQSRARRPHFVCQHPWRGFYLSRAGEVLTCYFDPHRLQAMDNVIDKRLDAVWRGDAMQSVRRAHRSGHLDDFPLCASCRLPDRTHPLGFIRRMFTEQWRFGRKAGGNFHWYC